MSDTPIEFPSEYNPENINSGSNIESNQPLSPLPSESPITPGIVQGVEVIDLLSYTRDKKIVWLALQDSSIVGYNVYRSEVSWADYEKINQNIVPINQLFFIDSNVPVAEVQPFRFYYKVTAINNLGIESDINEAFSTTNSDDPSYFNNPPLTYSPPQYLSQDNAIQPKNGTRFQILSNTFVDPRWFLEIRRRHSWLLQMGGTRVWLMRRKWSGTLCKNYNIERGQHKQIASADYTDTCYGINFEGGYHTPVEILISFFSPAVRRSTVREWGVWFDYEPTSWTLWEPNVYDHDVVVRADNGQRFELLGNTRTFWRNLVLRQNFETKLIEATDIRYKFPIPGITPSPILTPNPSVQSTIVKPIIINS